MLSRQQFYAHGKLLLSGEYFVLDGALALALPTQRGQFLEVTVQADQLPGLHWESYDADGSLWFKGMFDLAELTYFKGSDQEVGARLTQLLQAARQLNPAFLPSGPSYRVRTQLEFSRHWGLGSSSTLVSCLGQLAQVDPQQLLAQSFGGSGYDVACAQADGPILYERRNGQGHYVQVPWNPIFRDQLFLVYLGKKQDSRAGIQHYRQLKPAAVAQARQVISQLTADLFSSVMQLEAFEAALATHEAIVADALGLPRAQELYFGDFWGETKSLGAWGGDFILATSAESAAQTRKYFNEKGFDAVFPYEEMILG